MPAVGEPAAAVPPPPPPRAELPPPPGCTSTDTVGLRRDQLRRRIANLRALASALGAGITVFAAIKLAEGRVNDPLLMFLGALFLTFAIVAAAGVAYALIKVQWQYDLLNRFISKDKGGQNYGDGQLIDPAEEMRTAWATLKQHDMNLTDDRDCQWPVLEPLAYGAASFLAIFAAVTLMAYLWIPLVMSWTKTDEARDNDQPKPARQVLLHTTVFFESGASALSPAAERSLRDAVKGLLPLDDRCLLVEGYTDERASAEYNLQLGRMRADRVLSILESEGVPRASVLVSTFGESRPAATGRSQTSLAQNRRVEISLTSCAGVRPSR